jgi:predicted nucleic acid-binding protein
VPIIADFRVVLDACVLANYAVTDVFLTFAEEPRLYLPRWSEKILEETRRTHERLKWPGELIDYFQQQVREHFPEALVTDYERYIDLCENDPKDRHVLACAIAGHAEIIVTFNLRDFQPEALQKWNIVAMHPQDQLLSLYGLDPQIGLYKMTRIAFRQGGDLKDYLIDLGRFVPAFSEHILGEIG